MRNQSLPSAQKTMFVDHGVANANPITIVPKLMLVESSVDFQSRSHYCQNIRRKYELKCRETQVVVHNDGRTPRN